jgi:hypothetical protein
VDVAGGLTVVVVVGLGGCAVPIGEGLEGLIFNGSTPLNMSVNSKFCWSS